MCAVVLQTEFMAAVSAHPWVSHCLETLRSQISQVISRCFPKWGVRCRVSGAHTSATGLGHHPAVNLPSSKPTQRVLRTGSHPRRRKIYKKIYCMRPFFSASSSFCLCPAKIPAGESMKPSESTRLGAPRLAPKVWAYIWGCRQPWGETTVPTALKFWLCRLKERVQEVLHSPGIWVPSNLNCTACRACTAPGLLSPLQRASSLVHYSGLQGKWVKLHGMRISFGGGFMWFQNFSEFEILVPNRK